MFSAATKTGSQPSSAANYIEDVFNTWLYTGNGTTQTINSGIDLAAKGGLVWFKSRNNSTFANSPHALTDSVTGFNKYLQSQQTSQQQNWGSDGPAPNSTGFTLPINGSVPYTNYLTGSTYVAWTFAKQPKFFDVVTYTGTGSAQNISHNLSSIPGMIIVKSTSNGGTNWYAYHTSIGNTGCLLLNLTAATQTSTSFWNNTSPTSTQFTVGGGGTNNSGQTYVAYLFAHNAGGFGTAGTDNVISCGSYTTNASAVGSATLGFEPQYLLLKSSSAGSDWYVADVMRGQSYSVNQMLNPNNSGAEYAQGPSGFIPNATGFTDTGNIVANGTVIYMAIRRPMKVPTDATKVFSPIAYTGDNTSNRIIGSLQAGDSALVFTRNYNDYGYPQAWWNRLMGGFALRTASANAEVNQATTLGWDNQVGQLISNGSTNINYGGVPAGNFVLYNFARRPGFFDTVCYTGTGSATTFNHNLTVIPEMMIVKERDVTGAWRVYVSSLGNLDHMVLNSNGQINGGDMWNSTNPTATVFSLGTSGSVNRAAGTFVNYLFATCPGVSKVGSYTGNGTTQAISCGFTGGARFVMLKRTDAAGDWYTYDTARGMTTLTDPYLLMNSTASEVATLGSVTTTAGGFTLNSTILADINISGGNYIFLAIA